MFLILRRASNDVDLVYVVFGSLFCTLIGFFFVLLQQSHQVWKVVVGTGAIQTVGFGRAIAKFY